MKKSLFPLRLLLATMVASAAALTFSSCGGADAQVTRTSAPQLKTQAPGYYRMSLGDFTVTAIYDGYADLDPSILKNTTPEEVRQLLDNFYQTAPLRTSINAYLIHTGERLVLVDTGSAKKLGPTMGFLVENLRAAGYSPADVDTVILTHLHPDHVNGLIADDGTPVFPNADVHVEKAESDYWLDKAIQAAAPAYFNYVFEGAQAASLPYRNRFRWWTFNGVSTIVSGVTSYPLHGSGPSHTAGHTGYLVESRGQKMFLWGDVIHNHATQLTKPDIGVEFDTDMSEAIAARKAILQKAADERWLIAGAHMPFPGIGRVRSVGGTAGYEWVPIEYESVR